MKNIARRIARMLHTTRKTYAATIAYSGLLFDVSVEAPDERRARRELDEIADGGYIVAFAEA